MGQYWQLVNIDKRAELRNNGGLKLCEFVMNGSAEQLVGLLRKQHWVDFKVPQAEIRRSKEKSASSPFIGLPQEIIDAIASELLEDPTNESDEGFHSLICLSLTCIYFFRLLASTIQNVFRKDPKSWAGDRLIFVGDYASGYPEAIASAQEKLEWEKLGDNPLYSLPQFVKTEEKSLLDRAWDRLSGEARFKWLIDLLTEKPQLTASEAVLRNLGTKEYVRDTALAMSKAAFSLGEVIVIYSQWTDDPSGTEGLGTKGKWAGHRFDIGRVSDVASEGWKDVSENAVADLAMVARAGKTGGRRACDLVFY